VGDVSPCRKKWGDAVPPRPRPTTPLLCSKPWLNIRWTPHLYWSDNHLSPATAIRPTIFVSFTVSVRILILKQPPLSPLIVQSKLWLLQLYHDAKKCRLPNIQPCSETSFARFWCAPGSTGPNVCRPTIPTFSTQLNLLDRCVSKSHSISLHFDIGWWNSAFAGEYYRPETEFVLTASDN